MKQLILGLVVLTAFSPLTPVWGESVSDAEIKEALDVVEKVREDLRKMREEVRKDEKEFDKITAEQKTLNYAQMLNGVQSFADNVKVALKRDATRRLKELEVITLKNANVADQADLAKKFKELKGLMSLSGCLVEPKAEAKLMPSVPKKDH